MPVSGERSLMVRTVRSMSADVCTVDVGLLGLQRNTRPAPTEARIIPSRSRASVFGLTAMNLTGALMRCAVCAGEPYDGSPVTSDLSPLQYAITAAVRISPEPVEMITLFGLAPSIAAHASTKAPRLGGGYPSPRLLKLWFFSASITFGPGPLRFSLLLSLMMSPAAAGRWPPPRPCSPVKANRS